MTELSRREQNKVDTRERIIAAATTMFLSQGVEQSTVTEVAQQAGVSRGTFFNYFPTKDSVLAAMWEDMSTRFGEVVSQALDEDITTRQRIHRMFQNFVIAAQREPDYMLLVTGEMNRDQPTGETPTARSNHVSSQLATLMAAGQESGEVRTDHSPEFLGRMVAAGYFAAIMRWREKPQIELLAEFSQVANFVADSIAPQAISERES